MIEILHNLTVMRDWGLVSFPSSGRGLVVFHLSISKSRTSQRCPRNCSGVLAVTFLEGAQGLLSRFVRLYPVFRLHHSRGRRGCSGGLAVASLEDTEGLLSRFDCVYSDYITQGCPGGALAVAMSLRARCAFFPTHLDGHRAPEMRH